MDIGEKELLIEELQQRLNDMCNSEYNPFKNLQRHHIHQLRYFRIYFEVYDDQGVMLMDTLCVDGCELLQKIKEIQ